MLSFTGQVKATGAVLNWVTASERNAKGFAIERSPDGKAFNDIGFVNTKSEAGLRTNGFTYQFTDIAFTGKAFYRLRLVDVDGASQYSNVVFLEKASSKAQPFMAWPVPTRGQLQLSGPAGIKASFTLTTVEGKVIFKQSGTAEQVKTGFAGFTNTLPTGSYLLKIISEQGTNVQKVVKE